MVEISDLKKFDKFSLLSEDQLAEIAKITEKQTFKKGAQVYQEGIGPTIFFWLPRDLSA